MVTPPDFTGEAVGLEPRAKRERTMIGILVVSEVRLLREGIAEALKANGHLNVLGSASHAQAAAHAHELRPDVIFFDATRRSRIAEAKRIAAALPETKIVAFGVAETAEEILSLAGAGVAGYVRDDVSADAVASVIDSVMRDELVCSPRTAASLYKWVALRSRAEPGLRPEPPLSRRELEIVDLIERGLSNKEIARRLGIEATTVKNHVHNILDKLKVHRRGEAAARMRGGLRGKPARETPEAARGRGSN